MSAPARNAPAALPPPINFANRAAHAAASAAVAAAAAVAFSAPPWQLVVKRIHAMDDIPHKFNRNSLIHIGSLMLAFHDAEKGYSLNTVRGVEKDGVSQISGSGQ